MTNNSKKYISLARLSVFLDNIKAIYSQIGHKHTLSDISDYHVDTELSPNSNNPVANSTLDAEFDAIASSMNALELTVDSKSDASHTHDDKYYTETEVDEFLSNKSQVQIITWEEND